ncbi:MAG: FliA/WhiG family RNA polymerase sigma factor [Syntrophales bacterium]|nr:FliA/WhiG family RNA polymerase sigma factor [Syntrophales bacterium]
MTKRERDDKIKKYAPLVHSIVGRFMVRLPAGMAAERDDLINVGIIGLIGAIDRYDEAKCTSFEMYASFRIRGAVLDELRSRDYMNRGARERRSMVEKAVYEMQKTLKRQPEADEIAEYLGISLDEYFKIMDVSKNVMLIYEDELPEDLDGPYDEEEIFQSVENQNPFSILADREMKTRLVNAVKQLSKQEQMVLSLYYNDELTMKEIGKVLSLTESRVSQIHTQAVIRLRAMVHQSDNGKKRKKVTPKHEEKIVTGHHYIV